MHALFTSRYLVSHHGSFDRLQVYKAWFRARICKRLMSPGIDSTRQHRLAESIPGLPKRLQIRAQVLGFVAFLNHNLCLWILTFALISSWYCFLIEVSRSFKKILTLNIVFFLERTLSGFAREKNCELPRWTPTWNVVWFITTISIYCLGPLGKKKSATFLTC